MVPCVPTFLYALDASAEATTSTHTRRPSSALRAGGVFYGRTPDGHHEPEEAEPEEGHHERAGHRGPGDRGAEPDQVAGVRGRRERLRHPGRRDPPGVRPALRLGQDPAHPGPPRAGRRARRPGLRRRHRQGRRLHGHQRPGCHQPGHPDRGRLHGLGPDGRGHRPGRQRRDRHGRLPGGRHPRHHDADHQAQLPGHRPRRDPAHDRRGVLHRLHRPARPGAGRRRQGRDAADDDVHLAHRAAAARLPPGDPPARQADPRGGQADPRGPPPRAVRRRRRDPGRRRRRSCGCSRR